MIHFKFTKILVAILAANLLLDPISAVYTPRDLQAEETFSNIHSLYQYWCSNDYGNFPENVGDVYCYYMNNDVSDLPVEDYIPENPLEEEHSYADLDYDRVDSYADYNRTEKNSSVDNSPRDITEHIIEIDDNDENYVLVIGLTRDTIEAEQEILSKLQDKSHVGFASCKYSYNELKKVHEEIVQMMMGDTGICGAGITCNVSEPDSNGKFSTMENYVDITILPEFYKETAAMLEETYGDKVKAYSGEMAVDDVAIDESIEKKKEEDKENGMGVDIGGMTEPVYTDGINHPAPETSNKKKSIRATKALTVNDIFTFQTNWKKTAEVAWTITGKGKAEILSKKTNGYNLKIQAKKAGLIKITARNNKNKKTISQKVLILDKNGTVANQNQLTAALQSEEVKKITIKTEGNKKFTIPKGEYGNKKIVVNAPKSEITVEEQSILEHIIYKKSKQIRILGITKEKAKQIFGNPVDSLSGLDGDIFEMKNKTRVIVYYSSNSDSNTGIVNGTMKTEDRPAEIKDEAIIPMEEISVFYGTILEIYGDGISALVEPDQDAAIRASGDQVSVSLAINTVDNFSVGDRVEVKYYGGVMESYPLQINELEVNKVI